MQKFVFDDVTFYILVIIFMGAALAGCLILLAARLKKGADWQMWWSFGVVIFLVVVMVPEGIRLIHKVHTIAFNPTGAVLTFIGPLPSGSIEYEDVSAIKFIRHYTYDDERFITGSNWSLRLQAGDQSFATVETDDLDPIVDIKRLIQKRGSAEFAYYRTFGRGSELESVSAREVLGKALAIEKLPDDFETPLVYRIFQILDALPF